VEILEDLKQEQKNALKSGDFAKLSLINKRIFAIREQARKEKQRAKEQAREQRTAQKIDFILSY
jgi:hypothetical protein